MNWQKARQRCDPEVPLLCDGFDQASLDGRECWIVPIPLPWTAFPEYADYFWRKAEFLGDSQYCFTNVVDEDGRCLKMIELKWFECLPEFADDVALISWEEFVNG